MRTWMMIALLVPTAGCLRNTAFKCDTSAQCGAGGQCEATGYCSFADPTCGRKYGPEAGALAGQCVGIAGIDGGVDSPGKGSDAMIDAPASSMCPSDYMTITGGAPGRSYKVITMATDWVSQRSACATGNTRTYLAAPGSTGELAAIDTFVGAVQNYWIGVDDLATAGTWQTVKGATQTFLPWDQGNPSGNPNDQCVEVITQNAAFANTRCTTPFPAVCACE